MSDLNKIESEVLTRSKKWVEDFNNRNIKGCVDAYTIDAVVNARPMGTFKGIDQIEGFWRPFIETGAGELEYSNVVLAVENDNMVLLKADWKMNVGHGVIIQERWVKQPDGNWLLEYDDFEVLEQY
jgi:ketosteroid isomerase-like protein